MGDPVPLSQLCPNSNYRLVNGRYVHEPDPACVAEKCPNSEHRLVNGSYVRYCTEPVPEEETELGPEIHGTAIGGAAISTLDFDNNGGGVQLQYTELGGSFTHDRFQLGVDLAGPFLDSRISGLDGQDPIVARQAFMRLIWQHAELTAGISDTNNGNDSNNTAGSPHVQRTRLYSGAPVNTFGATGSFGNDIFRFLVGVYGSNYSAYPFTNDYPAGYTGMTLSAGVFNLAVNFNFGPETADSSDMRILFDTVASVQPTEAINIAVNYDEVYDENGGNGAHSRDLAFYFNVSHRHSDTFGLTWFNIFEYGNDPAGIVHGIPNNEEIRARTGIDFRYGPDRIFITSLEAMYIHSISGINKDDIVPAIRFGVSGGGNPVPPTTL